MNQSWRGIATARNMVPKWEERGRGSEEYGFVGVRGEGAGIRNLSILLFNQFLPYQPNPDKDQATRKLRQACTE